VSDRHISNSFLPLICSVCLSFASFSIPSSSAEAAPKKKKKPAATAAKKSSTAAPTTGLGMERSKSALPQSQKLQEPPKSHSLEAVKPPKSGNFYDSGTKEAEYEHILDEEIKTLYQLSQRNRKSPNRGEIWLRLGEIYVEKARLVDLREQTNYEKNLHDFAEKKTKIRPQLNQKAAHEYNEKAVQLYEWFIKDFPKDPKVDQALFFLGYNHFELGNPQMGERFYSELVKRFPDSIFITESHFALGEYYFENESWKKALENYSKVVKVKRARLNTFALYKSAWCLYRLNRTKVALQALERVVRQSRTNDRDENAPGGRKPVNKLRLAAEALKDYVPFYAEAGDPKLAETEFNRISGGEKQTLQMLERLAYIYADAGNRGNAAFVFRQLIAKNPTGERAAEYQYQVVLSYATHDKKESRRQMDIWLESFGPGSSWATGNAKNEKLVGDVAKLQETTLRNYVLQQHQEAQTSRAEYSQNMANLSYVQYFKYFPDSPKIAEMRFFHAELLFDMQKYEEAAKIYSWVADKEAKGPYHEKAVVNTLLALEKDLPSTKEIESKRGTTLEPIPFDPPVARFEKAGIRYIQTFPKGDKTSDIERRLGVLYYSYNHFDEAIGMFERILKEHPKTENAEIAGNLILDIFKLKNDMAGFADKGEEFLKNPDIANTKFGLQVRSMMEKAGYLRAEKTAKSGDSAKAAKEYEVFATNNKASDLTLAARFEAAVNYEKSGDLSAAIRNYSVVLGAQSASAKFKTAQNDSRNALARIYQQTGQLEAAAKQYYSYAAANPKDQKAINAYFNSGVLYDSLGQTGEAMQAYQAYFDQSHKADRVEVIFAQAELLRKKGSNGKAMAYYEKYLQAGPHSQVHAIQSTFLLAQHAAQLGQVSKSKALYQKTLSMYQSTAKSVKDETVKYAAESRFIQTQDTLRDLLAVKFTANDKQQAKAAGQVKILREKYINEMKDVIRFDNGPFIVAALASSGKMFESLANMFAKIPIPAGYQKAEADQYRGGLQQAINGFKNDAKSSYKTAIDKARELEVYTSWTRTAQQGFAALDGSNEDTGEIAADARAADWMGL
jgi:tetratricopeptide (TPR) repeat protein